MPHDPGLAASPGRVATAQDGDSAHDSWIRHEAEPLPDHNGAIASLMLSTKPTDSRKPAKRAALLSASAIRPVSGVGPLCVLIWYWAVGEDGVQLLFDVLEQSCGPFDLVG